jgi:hypothetical protein
MRGKMLESIIQKLETAEQESSAIPDSQVRNWMASNDPEVLGATYSLLMNETLVRRIAPSLPFDEVFTFLLKYFNYCLTYNPEGEWVDNRFSASCDFVKLFVSYWDERRERKYFDEMKSMLNRLYVVGPPDLKQSIEQAIIEHLFERVDIRNFFSDWQVDPQLSLAYNAGTLWVEGGGRSPLTDRKK